MYLLSKVERKRSGDTRNRVERRNSCCFSYFPRIEMEFRDGKCMLRSYLRDWEGRETAIESSCRQIFSCLDELKSFPTHFPSTEFCQRYAFTDASKSSTMSSSTSKILDALYKV